MVHDKHRQDQKNREHGPGHGSGVHHRVCNADLQKKKGCRQEGNAPPATILTVTTEWIDSVSKVRRGVGAWKDGFAGRR